MSYRLCRNNYKYLGLLFDEYVAFNNSIKMLAESAGRALGAIVAKFKHTKDIGYNAYTKLYECGVRSSNFRLCG